MGRHITKKSKIGNGDSLATPFSVFVHKLQDLLSRSEHFEVITVHQNSFDGNKSSAASMLAKQIRLKLIADDDSDIPRPYRNIMVSIHAIATFKALDDYLRPRISMSDRPKGPSRRDGLSGALAALETSGTSNLQSRPTERSLSGATARASSAATPTPTNSRGTRKSGQPKAAPATPSPAGQSTSATPREKYTS
jgi:E3 ubiquitin-protein ligase TRIP12